MKYRITKYDPVFRDLNGHYQADEWTSVSDIGKYYNGILFTTEEYLTTEHKYIAFYNDLLMQMRIKELKISNLEKYLTLDKVKQRLEKYNIRFNDQEMKLYCQLCDNCLIPVNHFAYVLKMILRELVWCRIYAPDKKIAIEFGYDYYTYLSGAILNDIIIKRAKEKGIFVESYNSDEGVYSSIL